MIKCDKEVIDGKRSRGWILGGPDFGVFDSVVGGSCIRLLRRHLVTSEDSGFNAENEVLLWFRSRVAFIMGLYRGWWLCTLFRTVA